MKHEAWDGGAILDSMVDVLGEGIRQICTPKTTKTLCGKRVNLTAISNGHSDCPHCLSIIHEREEFLIALKSGQI